MDQLFSTIKSEGLEIPNLIQNNKKRPKGRAVDRDKKKDELNPVLLVLGISALIFFGVFMICNWFDSASGSTLKAIKNPKNSSSSSGSSSRLERNSGNPQIPKTELMSNILPVQPTHIRRS